ncbi:hypothetical protein LTR93_003045 [Exophiala xenobiotica]|nr:hypothetical protein LTR93_003045 [Exophiala xenobiotica]
MVRRVTDTDTGLKVLWSTQSPGNTDGKDIDIVAVHGLGAHPDDTWTKDREAENHSRWPINWLQGKDSHRINWLQEEDMLPAEVPNARIMRYGYKSNWFGPDSIGQSARNVAKRLLHVLEQEREAVREMCLNRDQCSGIFNAVRGLVFFGTPFRGAVGMSVSQMVQAASQEYEKEDIETKPLEVLELGNELLQTLLDDFQTWVWPRMLQTQMACFYELQASEIGRIVGRERRKVTNSLDRSSIRADIERTIVVSENSGSLDLSERVSKYPLERTHFNMNKFAGKDEFDYQIVAKVVRDMAAKARQPSSAAPIPPASYLYSLFFKLPSKQATQRQEYCTDDEADECRTLNYQYHILFPMSAWRSFGLNISMLTRMFSPWCLPTDRRIAEISEALWHMPFDKDDLQELVGRDQTFEALLDSKLFRPKKHSRTALRGLGGVGKSRLAMEVAYRARELRPDCSIFWVQATNSLSFEKDYLAIGTLMGIPGLEQNGADVKSLVCRYLSQDSAREWLLILDDADDPILWAEKDPSTTDTSSPLIEYLPKSRTGSILVTTRSRRVASHLAGKNVVDLGDMEIEDAEQMLQNLLAKPEILRDHENTLELLDKLTCLPLAIVQAASYLNKNDESIKTYLELLRQPEDNVIELLSENFNDEGRYKTALNPIATTWLVSFRQIEQQNRLAADYLDFASCLSEKNIPQSLFPPAQIEKETIDAFGVLRGYGFFTRHDNRDVDAAVGPLYDMHRLVRLATRNWLRKEDALTAWTATVFQRVRAAFPGVNWETRNVWMLYLPHAQVLCDSKQCEDLRERHELHMEMSYCLNWSGKYDAAVSLLEIVYRWAEPTLGDDDEFKIKVCMQLGHCLSLRGRYVEAEDYVSRALEESRNALGREHTLTISCMMEMGTVYAQQGSWHQAELVLKEGLEVGKKVLGPEQPQMLSARAELAHVYTEIGRLDEAETMQVELLESREKCQGHEHPDTLKVMSDLSTIYRKQGRLEKAEKLSLEACEVAERILGPEHPTTFHALHRLSRVYYAQYRWKEAEEITSKCLENTSRVQGREAWPTLESMELLALVWKKQDRLEEAIELMRECVEGSAQTLGSEDWGTKDRSRTLDEWQQQLAAQAGDARSLSTIESSSRVAEEDVDEEWVAKEEVDEGWVDEAAEEPESSHGGTESSSHQQKQHGPREQRSQQQLEPSKRRRFLSRLVSRKKDGPSKLGG